MSKRSNEDQGPSRKTRFKKIHNQVAAEYRLERLREEEITSSNSNDGQVTQEQTTVGSANKVYTNKGFVIQHLCT